MLDVNLLLYMCLLFKKFKKGKGLKDYGTSGEGKSTVQHSISQTRAITIIRVPLSSHTKLLLNQVYIFCVTNDFLDIIAYRTKLLLFKSFKVIYIWHNSLLSWPEECERQKRVWRDESMVKSIGCSSRGRVLQFPATHNCLDLQFRGSTLSHRQKTNVHEIKICYF